MKSSLANMSRILAGAVALLATPLVLATQSAAAPKVALGTLICKGNGGLSLILGSKERMRCLFKTVLNSERHPYMATITKIGVDIGFKGESTLVWTVLGPTVDTPAGALEGTYGGVTAGIAVGIGGNANALIGGSTQSIVLQPLSLEGQTGLTISACVAGLTLESG
jgi:hypothetical protein